MKKPIVTYTELEPRKKVEFRFMYAVLFVIFVILVLIGYWSLVPVDILEIKKLPVPASKPSDIQSGRLINLRFDYCKYSDVHGVVERTLVSERAVITLPTYKEITPKGCDQVDAPVVLPYTIATQTFYIHYKITYRINPIKTVVEEFDTEEFDILPVKSVPVE